MESILLAAFLTAICFNWACHMPVLCMVQNQAELARYCHLPIGNMSGDWVLSTADAIYARCLRDAGHLLWIADPALPDVAVRSEDGEGAEQLLENSQLTMEACPCLSLHWSLYDKPSQEHTLQIHLCNKQCIGSFRLIHIHNLMADILLTYAGMPSL